MRSIGANFIHTVLVQIPTMFLGIFTGIFLTRLLGPVGKGEYIFILANVELFTLFLTVASENGVVYFGANKKIPVKELGGIITVVYLFSILIFAAVLLVDYCIHPLVFLDGSKSFWIYVFMIFNFFTGLVGTYCSSFIRSIFQFKIVNRVTLANAILNFIVFGIVFYQIKWLDSHFSVTQILAISFFTLLTNTVIWIYYYWKYLGFWPAIFGFNRKDFKSFFAYNFIGYLGMLVNFFNYKIDLWFIGYYSNDRNLGFYSTAVNTAQFLLLFSRNLAMILQPYMSKFSDLVRVRQFKVYSRINFLIVFIGVAVLIPGARIFIELLFGSEFNGSIDSFRILLFAMVFLCSSQILYIFYAGSDMNSVNLKANIVGLVVCVCSNFVLIPLWGIDGAAISSVLCYAVIFVILYITYLVRFPDSTKNIFIPGKSDFKQLFSSSDNS